MICGLNHVRNSSGLLSHCQHFIGFNMQIHIITYTDAHILASEFLILDEVVQVVL